MKRFVMIGLVLAGVTVGCFGEAGEDFQISVVARVPPSVSVQLAFAQRLAIEAGVALTGPAVFAIRPILPTWELGKLTLIPSLGLGGAVAFLPGDLIAWGAYGLAGLEWTIPKTKLSLLTDLVMVLPLPVGKGTLHVGPQVGVCLRF